MSRVRLSHMRQHEVQPWTRLFSGYKLPRRPAAVAQPPTHIPGMAAYARHISLDSSAEDAQVGFRPHSACKGILH